MADPNKVGTPPDQERVMRDAEDAVTYPVLTEEVSFPRSGGGPTTGASSLQSGAGLGQAAALAIGDVLGWKVSGTDPKGFVGALTQAFTLTDVEGHVESKWNPRTYAVQTDLGGGITGAQASLYSRAKDALDQSLSLLDGLYPLDPDADPEYVKALREMARSQMTEIVREFGAVGLPSILRIDTYFKILLGQDPRHFKAGSTTVQFDPDEIKGTLGELRDTYGIYFRGNRFNNSIEDEQDITNFRVISDYMTSLMQSWIANREFFFLDPDRQAFFGTQLVLISRQLNVIAETVEEVRFVLDSVFIGPNERRTLLLKFEDHTFPPMFLEDVLEEIESFVKDEGPRLLRDGGKISVKNNILPVVKSLKDMVIQARDPQDKNKLPDGFRTARVRHSLDDLRDQLGALIRLTEQVEQKVPLPDGELTISGLSNPTWSWDGDFLKVTIFGHKIHLKAKVEWHSDEWKSATVEYYSAERIDVTLASPTPEVHELRITNPDGRYVTHAFEVPHHFKAKPTITNTNLPSATAGTPWTCKLQVTGGTEPYVITMAQDSFLPVGLELKGGAITGTPSVAGTSAFFVKVTDADKFSTIQQMSIAVASDVEFVTTQLPDATAGSPYSYALQATGGIAPYTWTFAVANPLPAGLSANNGVISGTPIAAGSQTLSVTVTDTNLSSATETLNINVVAAVAIKTTKLPDAWEGLFYSQILQLIGGTPNPNWTVTSPPPGSIPLGLTLSSDGVLSGTPGKAGESQFSVTVEDDNGSTATQPLSIKVHGSLGSLVDRIDRKVETRINELDAKLDRLIEEVKKERRTPQR